jgi:hypothetical protein
MMHAKTAVADSHWVRIGSTNLNVNSWIGNWELDVAIDSAHVAAVMEAHFEDDLRTSTEITMTARGRLMSTPPPPRQHLARRSARRAAREVAGVARSVGAALTGSRPLEDFEVGPLVLLGAAGLAVAVIAFLRPWVIAWPLATLLALAGLSLSAEAWRAWRTRENQ